MATFVVLGSSNPEKLDKSINENFPERYSLGVGQWLVAVESTLTTKEVSELIDGNGAAGSFVVFPVNNYWGRHSPNTWEWIQKKGAI